MTERDRIIPRFPQRYPDIEEAYQEGFRDGRRRMRWEIAVAAIVLACGIVGVAVEIVFRGALP